LLSVAIAFAPTLPGWWRPLALGSAVMGLMAFAVFWDGQRQLLFEEGGVGALASVALFIVALTFPQMFD
jgi:hypothetical protein